MLASAFLLAAATATSYASTLFVASYDGNVTTLSLSGNHSLTAISKSTNCGATPSWLTLDAEHRTLYCIDEGTSTLNGSISSLHIGANGSLALVDNETTIGGPVHGALYGQAPHRSIALAHYGTNASVSTFGATYNGTFTREQNITFSMAAPGPNAARQASSHPHEVVLDPLGEYLLVPDLGADLVRVFCFDDNGELYEHEPLKAAPGSGPRHAAFWSPSKDPTLGVYLYVVTELTSTVTAYQVTYLDQGGLNFTQVYNTTAMPAPMPAGNAAAEIAVSPDNRFLVVSNRNDSSFQIQNFDPNNSTLETSDSISTFAINQDASLTFTQLSPAGGIFPRQFQINEAGDRLAVGLQLSSRVVIIERNVTTGMLGQPLAAAAVSGQITCVRWNELPA